MSFLDDIWDWFKEEGGPPEGSPLAIFASRIVGSFPFPLLLCDERLSILAVNRLFNRTFMMKGGDGKNLADVLTHEVKIVRHKQEEPITDLNAMLDQRNPKVLSGLFPKIGQKTFHLYSRKISVAGEKGVLLVLQDVTEMRGLEEMIDRSRYELLSIFDGVEDPMVLIDKNMRIRRINRRMLTVLGGRSYRDFVGKACYFKLHGLNEPCSACMVPESFRTGEKRERTGLLEKSLKGDESTYQIICYPIKDNKGEATSMAECYRDMTEVVKIREELYESERSRVMESFAAGVAHEVRNPLAVIQSNAQLCLDQVGEKDNDLKEGLEAIIKSVQTANRVIKGLMNFARPQEVEFERQSVGPILKEGLDLIKGRARKQSVGLKILILSRLPKIIVDKKRFLQAYLNFLLNSLDAMPKGGKIEVSVKNNRKEKKMEILIKDTGEGISEEIIPRVFQPFYSTKKEGLGLGLPIAEGIIRSHGGEVVFKSCRGKGCEVRIELPV